MSPFTLTGATRKLIRRAMKDEAFRKEFFANKDTLITTYEIPEDDNTVLQRELFAGVVMGPAFDKKLANLAGSPVVMGKER